MLLEALAERIRTAGGEIHLSRPATGLRARAGRIVAVAVGPDEIPADLVICALPLPEVVNLLPEEVAAWRSELAAVDFLGVSCLLVHASRPLTDQYWINVADARVPCSGVIEYSNLNREIAPGQGLAYLPLYTPADDNRFLMPPEALTEELLAGLRMIVPDLPSEAILGTMLTRDECAQAVCPPGFAARVPLFRNPPLAGLHLLDSTMLYPSDRCLSGMIGLARELVESLL